MSENKKIIESLYAAADGIYRDFSSKLIPTVDKDKIIGVRTPILRAMARDILKSGVYRDFIKGFPHKFFEENQLHAFIISAVRDFDGAIHAVDNFLPYVDNWATCDQASTKAFQKHKNELLPHIVRWIKSDHTYTVRFAIGKLMQLFLDEDFKPQYLEMVAAVHSEEYYINMMIAWYFATALAKQYEATLPYIEKNRLEKWTHNKAIQKAIESYRITDEHKAYLRTLKIK